MIIRSKSLTEIQLIGKVKQNVIWKVSLLKFQSLLRVVYGVKLSVETYTNW